jgi:hypothetical protein
VIDAGMGLSKGGVKGEVAVFVQLAREERLACRIGLSPMYQTMKDATEVAKSGKQSEPGAPVFFDVGDGGKGLVSLHAIKFVLGRLPRSKRWSSSYSS